MPNGRRIFAESHYTLGGKVLPFEDFKLYIDRPNGFSINPEHDPVIIRRAEELLGREYPVMTATDFMLFVRTGDRGVYQEKYFPRRDDILTLALAEYVEKKGRFLDKVIDLLWMMCEETTWCLPAHNRSKEMPNCHSPLPDTYNGEFEYIDLFIGTTGATLSFVGYLLEDKLNAVCPLLVQRLHFELDRRIIRPFLDEGAIFKRMGWSGVYGGGVNNWCPWIVSNVLCVAALHEKSLPRRTAVIEQAMRFLDNFTSGYLEDGGCDEGPGYWSGAGGALYDSMLVLRDMTGGYVDAFQNDLVRKMGEYIVKVVVADGVMLSVSDSHPRSVPNGAMVYDWGKLSGSDMMTDLGQTLLRGELQPPVISSSDPYRGFRLLGFDKLPAVPLKLPLHFYLNGLQIAGSRESVYPNEGLYLMLKGGHNEESHNHNDVGEFVIYSNGNPLFIDCGAGSYTRKTFSDLRYTIWTNCSDYHNLPTVNGKTQLPGSQYHASEPIYDETSGELSLELKNAFPSDSGILSLRRSARLENGVITISDRISLDAPGPVFFSLMTPNTPDEIGEGYFTLSGRRIEFDSSLVCEVENVDCSTPETGCVPRGWKTDAIRRIKLSAKEYFSEKTFVLTVH